MQVEEARRKESERTGKVNEEMATARNELKRVDKEMRSLQACLLLYTQRQLIDHRTTTVEDGLCVTRGM